MSEALEENIDFRLCQFSIVQGRTAMKVGTDALVLGAWTASCAISAPRKILDVGTGTAILALMLAQRFPSSEIRAIDIDLGAIADAEENIKHSPYRERICVELLNFSECLTKEPPHYDLIISNPPYFTPLGLASPDKARYLARHDSSGGLGLHSLIAGARLLLRPRGSLCLIFPYDRLEELRLFATESLMTIEELCLVYSRENQPIRYLARLSPLCLAEGYRSTEYTSLVLRATDGVYTDAYRDLLTGYLLADYYA